MLNTPSLSPSFANPTGPYQEMKLLDDALKGNMHTNVLQARVNVAIIVNLMGMVDPG